MEQPDLVDMEERRKVIINYVPQYFSDGHVHELLRWHPGYRRSNIVRNWRTGRSQGFAFAEFQTREDAQNCVSYFEMAGQILGCQSGGQLRVGDKRIKFSLARPQNPVYQRTKVFIPSIPLSWTEHQVARYFEDECGPIEEVRIVNGGRSLVKKAFVTFRTHSSAVLALDFSGQTRSFQERDESSPVKYVRLDIERYWDV